MALFPRDRAIEQRLDVAKKIVVEYQQTEKFLSWFQKELSEYANEKTSKAYQELLLEELQQYREACEEVETLIVQEEKVAGKAHKCHTLIHDFDRHSPELNRQYRDYSSTCKSIQVQRDEAIARANELRAQLPSSKKLHRLFQSASAFCEKVESPRTSSDSSCSSPALSGLL